MLFSVHLFTNLATPHTYIYVEQQDAALVFILLVLLLLSDSWNFSSLTSDNECIPELERTRECSP